MIWRCCEHLRSALIVEVKIVKNWVATLLIGFLCFLAIGSASAQLRLGTMEVVPAGGGDYTFDLNSNGEFTILDGSEYSFSRISGQNSILTLNAPNGGTLVLGGINTYDGGTIVNSGTLRIEGTIGPGGDIFINTGGIFHFSRGSSSMIYDIPLSSNISLRGSGTFKVTDLVRYGGLINNFGGSIETTVNGRLQLHVQDLSETVNFINNGNMELYNTAPTNTLTLGSLSGTNNSAILNIDNTIASSEDFLFRIGNNASTTYAGKITSSTRNFKIQKVGTGTLTLSGDISDRVELLISDGIVQLGDGGTTGTYQTTNNQIDNNSIFAINRSDNFTFRSSIVGTGSVHQVGTGTTVFTRNGNTYSDSTYVKQGRLELSIIGLTKEGDGANKNTKYVVDAGATLIVSQPYQFDYSGREEVFINGGTLVVNNLTYCNNLKLKDATIVSSIIGGLRLIETVSDNKAVMEGTNSIAHLIMIKNLVETGNPAVVLNIKSGVTSVSKISESGIDLEKGALLSKKGSGTLLLNGNSNFSGVLAVVEGSVGGNGTSSADYWVGSVVSNSNGSSIFGGIGSNNAGTHTFDNLTFLVGARLKVYSDGLQLSKIACTSYNPNSFFVDLEDPMPTGTYTLIEIAAANLSLQFPLPTLGVNNSGHTVCFGWKQGTGLTVSLSSSVSPASVVSNVCNTSFSLTELTELENFTREYSFDNGVSWIESRLSPTSTPNCYTTVRRYNCKADGAVILGSPKRVIIFPPAPSLTASSNVCVGETASPAVAPVNGFTGEYAYKKDNGAFSSYSTSIPPLTSVGKYAIKARYKVSASCGGSNSGDSAPANCLESSEVEVNVYSLPSAPVVGSISQPTCKSPEANVELSGLPSDTDGWILHRLNLQTTTTASQDWIDTSISVTDNIPSGTYSFTVENKSTNCISLPTSTVLINSPIEKPVIGGATSVCNGQIARVTVTSNPGTNGVWSWDAVNSGAITISSTGVVQGTKSGTVDIKYNSNECSATIKFIVKPQPTTTGEQKICVGSSVDISASVQASPTTTWTSSSTNIVTVPNDGDQSGKLEGISIGYSDITYTDVDGCISNPIRITVHGSSTPQVLYTQKRSCTNSLVSITTNMSSDGEIYTLKWYDIDMNPITPSSPFTFPIYSDTSIIVEAVNSSLSTCKSMIEVPIIIAPVESFAGSIMTKGDVFTVAFGEKMGFLFVGDIVTTQFSWDFGDGSIKSSENSPTHYYYQVGEFEPTLTLAGSDDLCEKTFKLSKPIVVTGSEFDVITGDSPSKVENEIRVSPIPFRDVVKIISDKMIHKVGLYDTNGDCLELNLGVNSMEYSINIAHLPSGVYILNIVDNYGVKHMKVIKQ